MSNFGQLFRTKSLDALVGETQQEGHQLQKVLGPWNLIALGVGAIIGAGIFATIGCLPSSLWCASTANQANELKSVHHDN